MARLSSRVWLTGAYCAMLLAGVVIFVVVCTYGNTLTAPAPGVAMRLAAPGSAAAPVRPDIFLNVLLALAAVIGIGQLLGSWLRAIGQPPVIGEVVAGIALGPSLLGHLAPRWSSLIFPPDVFPLLAVIAQLGVVLYMFVVGLELNAGLLRDRVHATVATSHASIVTPFVLGTVLALLLYPRVSTSDVSFTSFALFMGVAMSITAFPVLARILTDSGLTTSRLGTMALTCAAVDDVTAWCLLAIIVGIVRARVSAALIVLLLAGGFVAVVYVVLRPMVKRLVDAAGDGPPTPWIVGVTLLGVLLSASVTEAIGIHAIFGAFLFGSIIPHDSRLAATLKQRLEQSVTILLLPAFFALTGMRTRVGLLANPVDWLLCALIIVTATAGKFGGSAIASRLVGMDWHHAIGLGILMNTRGLMELIVLNVGLDMGLLSPKLFTMMVLMALITSLMTTPVLNVVRSRSLPLQSTTWLKTAPWQMPS